MARSQFYDVIDIVSTILEVVRILEQTKLDGIPQKEIGGRRMGTLSRQPIRHFLKHRLHTTNTMGSQRDPAIEQFNSTSAGR